MKRTAFKPKLASIPGILRTANPKTITKLTLVAKPRTCKCTVCRTSFVKRSMSHVVCSPTCALVLAKRSREKSERKQLASRKEAIKPRAKWLAETQSVVNALVRWRDRDDGCISCDKPSTWQGQWHASHFKSVGSSPALRFDLSNIHKSCSVCNNWLSGNIGAYRLRLIVKIGQEEVDRLEGPQDSPKWSIDDLKVIKLDAKIALKEMK